MKSEMSDEEERVRARVLESLADSLVAMRDVQNILLQGVPHIDHKIDALKKTVQCEMSLIQRYLEVMNGGDPRSVKDCVEA